LTCPHCGNDGTFEGVAQDVFNITSHKIFGVRRCPNLKCNGHVFFVFNNGTGSLEFSHPKSKINFDPEGIPDELIQVIEEAITCLANNCYVASAIMIRKALEILCHLQGATGGNLYKRIEALSKKIVLPQALNDAMQDLRLLGNDAAHIDATTFSEISKEELEVSFELTFELLKAAYQYTSLLGKLNKLKKEK
jgi:hypothetical protein